ncbi:hypothetical protein EYF80_014815 [Liparis tanakae]|uniref:Uncharacterized protein n=1 Tax=Liparis tanakae TaxID=230148 RepID=A0A4Z2IAB1_9TELE|nr:hypothetical protein EYF80_014815 [Liparis tanakae]
METTSSSAVTLDTAARLNTATDRQSTTHSPSVPTHISPRKPSRGPLKRPQTINKILFLNLTFDISKPEAVSNRLKKHTVSRLDTAAESGRLEIRPSNFQVLKMRRGKWSRREVQEDRRGRRHEERTGNNI